MCLSLSETIQRLFMLLRLSLLFFSVHLKNPSVTKIEYGKYFAVNVLSDSHQFFWGYSGNVTSR